MLVLLLGIVFEDTHIPGNVVKMFHDSNGLKYVNPIKFQLAILSCFKVYHPASLCSMMMYVCISMATKLLACTSEELTLHALKLIGEILHHSNDRYIISISSYQKS